MIKSVFTSEQDLILEEQTQERTVPNIIDKKDLAALWAVGILFSLLLISAGRAWEPARYEAVSSDSLDPLEAEVENGQNKTVAEALNSGKIQYNPSMKKLVRPLPATQLFWIDLAKTLLSPTLPIVIVGLLIRKTLRRSEPHSG